jgi:hypothetical protein
MMTEQDEKQEAVAGVGMLVAAFTNEEAGEEALKAFKQAKKEGQIYFEEAAVIKQDADGEVHYHETGDMTTGKGAGIGALLGGLASSDIFLGWHQGSLTDIHYYWRQLKDMKGSVDASALDEDGFRTYVVVCAVCLARAHARAGDAAAISGYMGKGKSLGKAIADFAVAYADQTEGDHQALEEAVKSGRIQAQTGI